MFSSQGRSQPIVTCGCRFIVCLLLSGIASAAPSITLSKKSGPPTSKILVSGQGFKPNVGVNIFFDTKDKALVVTSGKGEFHDAGIYAPRSARPGQHWVTALERNNDKGAQEPFLVQTDWSEFHFDADGTRLNPYENVLNPRTVSSMDLKWSYASAMGQSSPAVVDGVVYVAGNTSLYALDANTGSKLWSYDTGFGVQSSPAVANGIVYIDSDDGTLYALNARTGAKMWKYFTGAPASSPAVTNGTVYVGAISYVFAFSASTGALRWSYPIGSAVSSPVVANGVLYVGGYYSIYALDARTGAKLWSYKTGDYVYESSPAVADGVVYIGSFDSNLYALNARTGTLLWSYNTGYPVSSSPAVADGAVFIASDVILALDARTGAKLWEYDVYLNGSSPGAANGVVYVSSFDTNLYALNALTGALLWTYTTGNSIGSSPAVANGIVFVSSYAFDLTRGRMKSARAKQEADSNRPGLNTLRPDFNRKTSK